MKEFSTISFNVSEGVGKITLSRPEKHNAMNRQMIDELKDVASQIIASDNIRLVILRAEGQTFCAGGDLTSLSQGSASSGTSDGGTHGLRDRCDPYERRGARYRSA